MPNRLIEIHDSILASLAFENGSAKLYFKPAYIHESEGEPGVDAGSGWVQEAILRIHDAKVEGAFPKFPVDLSDGQTRMGQDVLDNALPVPLRYKGSFDLRLKAKRHREEVSVVGSGAELELLGEPKYVEEFRP